MQKDAKARYHVTPNDLAPLGYVERTRFHESPCGPSGAGIRVKSKLYAVVRVKQIAEAKAAKKAEIAGRKAAKEERKQAKLAKKALEAGDGSIEDNTQSPIDVEDEQSVDIPTATETTIDPLLAIAMPAQSAVDRQAQIEADKLVQAKHKLDQAKAALGVADADDVDSPAAIRAFVQSLGVGNENTGVAAA